jgi:hypothetical protein
MTHNFSCSRVIPLAALTNRSINAAVSGAFSILLVMPSNQFGVVSSPRGGEGSHLGHLSFSDLGVAFMGALGRGIRPLLVPRVEIDALSVAMLVQHADRAEQMAFIKEDRAWRYSDSFEQGKWRRVRKTIERLRRDARPSAERG